MTHGEYASSLREIADFFESHPEIELPYDCEKLNYFNLHKCNILAVSGALGSFAKEYDADFEGSFALVRKFGSIAFRAITQRSEVCSKRVVGTKHVERRIVPERVVEAHDEEIVEWDCESILSASAKELTDALP